MITGSSPSEGKTTTAVNLAVSLALAGQRTILIEADSRKPRIGQALGVSADRGIASVLIDNLPLAEALVTTEAYGDRLKLLLVDREGDWMADQLSLPGARRLIDEAKRMADFVIFDSPPLTTVIDALAAGGDGGRPRRGGEARQDGPAAADAARPAARPARAEAARAGACSASARRATRATTVATGRRQPGGARGRRRAAAGAAHDLTDALRRGSATSPSRAGLAGVAAGGRRRRSALLAGARPQFAIAAAIALAVRQRRDGGPHAGTVRLHAACRSWT